MNAILSLLSGPIGSVLTPVVTAFLGKLLLNAHIKLDSLSAPVKQGAVVLIAGVLTAAQAALGVDVCGGQACSIDTIAVPALASAAVAFVLHSALKLKK